MELGIGKALEYSALGIAIVFALIIVLMIVVKIMSVIITGAAAARNKSVATASGAKNGTMPKAQTTEAAQVEKALAPGSVGDVKLYNVSDRDAAMIMAIVADKMQVPLNELRFLSIREVNEDEV